MAVALYLRDVFGIDSAGVTSGVAIMFPVF
jgi:hypothetical protein